jgi:uroporphyrinogen-III synthase
MHLDSAAREPEPENLETPMTTPASQSPSFAGRTVATFESRLSGPMADLVVKFGGVPMQAPALREIPFGANAEALAFADDLLAGRFDVVIFLTGVGTRFLAQAIETRHDRAAWLAALAKTKVVVRGPKPLAALGELKARVDLRVPEPNTWHELLAAVDAELPMAGRRVAVQEYGKSNPELLEGLIQRGAEVTRVPVYRWALPEDTEPLRQTIAAMVAGKVDIALFTSAQQIEHLLQVAAEDGREQALRATFDRPIVVGSIGPTTSETLRAHELPVDIEPEHPKMGHLVAAAASGWQAAVARRASQSGDKA